MKIPQFVKKLTGGVTLVCFMASSCSQPLLAAPPGPNTSFQSLIVSKLAIPQETGTIEEFFQGNKPFQVVLIRDAHAIPEAQRNIQALIEIFQKNYGIRRVGVEGGVGQMDAQILWSFPNKEKLREILNTYLERGEWTGVNGSAVFSGENTVYEGLEDWELYQQGLEGYQAALNQQTSLLTELTRQKEKLQQDKQKIYSPALLKIDTALERFETDRAELGQALLVLWEIQKPSSPDLLAMLEGIKEKVLEASGHVANELNELALGIKRKDSLEAEEKAVFNAKFQAYQTGQINAPEFAGYLQGLEPLPSNLKNLAERHHRLQDLEGTRVMKDFEAFAQSVKESLFVNENERDLDRKGKEIRLLERFARLELNREDWESLKDQKLPKDAWQAHAEFYKNAQMRESVMGEKLLKLATKENVLVVAGGFHTEGLTVEFKKNGISYLVVRPNIQALPDKTFYQNQMRGDVSWNRYFRPRNGKVNLYQAFIQALRDDLLKADASSDRGLTLKAWRDQLIRDLASTGKQGEIQKYAAMLQSEEGITLKKESMLREKWIENIDSFIEKFQLLQTEGKLTEDAVLKIIQPSAIPSIIVPVLFSRSEIRESLLAREGKSQYVQRSEVRSAEGDSVIDKEIAATREAIDQYLKSPGTAKDASENQIIRRIEAFDVILMNDNVNPEKRIDLALFIAASFRKILDSENMRDLDIRVIGRVLVSFQHAINVLGGFLGLNLTEASKRKLLLQLSVIMENTDEIFKSLQETLETPLADLTETDKVKMPMARSFGRAGVAMIEIFVRVVEWLGKQNDVKTNLAWAYFFSAPAEFANDYLQAAKNSQYLSNEIKYAINERQIPSLQITLSGSDVGNNTQELDRAIIKLEEMANSLREEDEDFTLQRTRKILGAIEKLRKNYPKLEVMTRSEARELGHEWIEQLEPVVNSLTSASRSSRKKIEAFERLDEIVVTRMPAFDILVSRGQSQSFRDVEIENVMAVMRLITAGYAAAAFESRMMRTRKYAQKIDAGFHRIVEFYRALHSYLNARTDAWDRPQVLTELVAMSDWMEKVMKEFRAMTVRTRKLVEQPGAIREDQKAREYRLSLLGLAKPISYTADSIVKTYFDTIYLLSETDTDEAGKALRSAILRALSDLESAFITSADLLILLNGSSISNDEIKNTTNNSLNWLDQELRDFGDKTAAKLLENMEGESDDNALYAGQVSTALASARELLNVRSEIRQNDQISYPVTLEASELTAIAFSLCPSELGLEPSQSDLKSASQHLSRDLISLAELRQGLISVAEKSTRDTENFGQRNFFNDQIARLLAIQEIESNLLKTLEPANFPEGPFAFGTVLPEKNSREFASLFVKAVRPGAVVMVEGKLPGGFDKEIRSRGGQIRPESMNRAVELPGNQPDAAIVLEDGFAGIFHEMFRPFSLDPKNLDTDARHLGVTLLSVAAAHYGMLVSQDPELRLKPETLKQELLNRLQQFEEFPDLFEILSSGKTWGLSLVSEKLEEFINQRAAQVSA